MSRVKIKKKYEYCNMTMTYKEMCDYYFKYINDGKYGCFKDWFIEITIQGKIKEV